MLLSIEQNAGKGQLPTFDALATDEKAALEMLKAALSRLRVGTSMFARQLQMSLTPSANMLILIFCINSLMVPTGDLGIDQVCTRTPRSYTTPTMQSVLQ